MSLVSQNKVSSYPDFNDAMLNSDSKKLYLIVRKTHTATSSDPSAELALSRSETRLIQCKQGASEGIGEFKIRYENLQKTFVGLGGVLPSGKQQGIKYWQALDSKRYSSMRAHFENEMGSSVFKPTPVDYPLSTLAQAHAVAANWVTAIPEPNRVSSHGVDEAVFSTLTQHGASRGGGRGSAGSGRGGRRSGYTYKGRGGARGSAQPMLSSTPTAGEVKDIVTTNKQRHSTTPSLCWIFGNTGHISKECPEKPTREEVKSFFTESSVDIPLLEVWEAGIDTKCTVHVSGQASTFIDGTFMGNKARLQGVTGRCYTDEYATVPVWGDVFVIKDTPLLLSFAELSDAYPISLDQDGQLMRPYIFGVEDDVANIATVEESSELDCYFIGEGGGENSSVSCRQQQANSGGP
jgi:hypothetical protein